MGLFLATVISFILNLFYKLFKLAVKIVKDLLVATKLIFPALCALAGGILMLTGSIVYGEMSFIYFALVMSLSLALTVFLWYKDITRQNSRNSANDLRRTRRDTRTNRRSGRYLGATERQNDGGRYTDTANYRYDDSGVKRKYNFGRDSRAGKRFAPSQREQSTQPLFVYRDNSAKVYPEDGAAPPNPYNYPPSGNAQNFSSYTQGQQRSAVGGLDKNRQVLPEDGKTGRFYRVKQNPKFVMRELPEYVELYEETPQGLRFIRTDSKGGSTDSTD